jgi:hypothetical protein
MGRELMRTPAQAAGAHDVRSASPEAALDEPAASAPIARGGMAALRDPRVRGAIGNRAVGRVLSRQPAPPPTKTKPEHKSGTEFHIPGNQYEYAYKIKWGRASASFKSTASWQSAKAVKTTGPGGVNISVLEDKRSWEREGTNFGRKVIEAAAKLDKEVGHLGPVTIKLNVKALEAAVGTKDGKPNLDLNLLTASFTAEGDIAEEYRKEFGISKDFAPTLKLVLTGEGKVALKAGDLLKLTEFVKAKRKEVEAAEQMLKDAQRAEVVEKELGTIEKQIGKAPKQAEVKALENRFKTFQGYGKRQAPKRPTRRPRPRPRRPGRRRRPAAPRSCSSARPCSRPRRRCSRSRFAKRLGSSRRHARPRRGSRRRWRARSPRWSCESSARRSPPRSGSSC